MMLFFDFEESELELKKNKKAEKIIRFEIHNLFGENDVELEFNNEDSIEVYIGMNGIGKTSILNMFYYTISGDFLKLREFMFDSVKIITEKGRELYLNRKSLFEIENPEIDRVLKSDLRKVISFENFRKMNYVLSKNDFFETEAYFMKLFESEDIPGSFKSIVHREILNANQQTKTLRSIRKFLRSLNLSDILYFPTYRRIEDDASKIGIDIEDELEKEGIAGETKLIKFGMNDVELKINDFRDQIKIRTLKSYQSLTQNLLNHLMTEEKMTTNQFKNLNDFELIERIIYRLGKEIKFDINTLKDKIINTNNLNNERYSILFFYLNKLVESYKEYEWIDEALDEFCSTCNRYLRGKKFKYDKHTVSVFIENEATRKKIPLSLLSSGEKQIVSLFAHLYLTNKSRFIILFDEPELSLSIEWQERLLKDIKASNKIELLIAVTHSPFIISEEFTLNANSMELFISPSSNTEAYNK